MRDQFGNYYRNAIEAKRAQGQIVVGNETFPIEDEGKFVFQVNTRAGYEAPENCVATTQEEAEADMAAWLDCYPDADCRVVEI